MDDNRLHRCITTLFEDAQHEFREYIELLVEAWMQRNGAEIEEIELVVDTFDPDRITLYPRIKTTASNPDPCACQYCHCHRPAPKPRAYEQLEW